MVARKLLEALCGNLRRVQMNKYKFLLSIILKETKITPQELNEIIKKHDLDEHLERPLRFFYNKSQKDINSFDK